MGGGRSAGGRICRDDEPHVRPVSQERRSLRSDRFLVLASTLCIRQSAKFSAMGVKGLSVVMTLAE